MVEKNAMRLDSKAFMVYGVYRQMKCAVILFAAWAAVGLHAGLGACPPPQPMRQKGFGFASPRFGKDALISNDGAHTSTVVAAAVASPVGGVARIEVEEVGDVRVDSNPRG